MSSVRWLLTALVAALFVLTGCSTPSASEAATVNGVPIPVSAVEGPVQAVGVPSGESADPNATVLTYAIRGEIARTIAAEQGIQLTGDPRTAALAALDPALAKYADDPQASSLVNNLLDFNVVVGAIGEAAYLQRVAQTPVEVNPRFGSWSIESAAVSLDGGQLSEPWATPSAPA